MQPHLPAVATTTRVRSAASDARNLESSFLTFEWLSYAFTIVLPLLRSFKLWKTCAPRCTSSRQRGKATRTYCIWRTRHAGDRQPLAITWDEPTRTATTGAATDFSLCFAFAAPVAQAGHNSESCLLMESSKISVPRKCSLAT